MKDPPPRDGADRNRGGRDGRLSPRPLLEQAADYFAAQGWPAMDLTRFRMAEGDEGTDDESTDDTDSDPADGGDDELAATRKALAKANKEAEKTRLRLKEYEDRDKSETEKLTERTRDLESTLTSTQAQALRFEIALDKGIPKAIAQRLQGATREEMEADADELLKTIGDGKKPPSFDGGAKGADAPEGGSFLTKAIRNRA